MDSHNIIKKLEQKYQNIGASLKDLEGYIVNLDPELPVPFEEAMLDYEKLLNARKQLENANQDKLS